jgi:hypothetical protein
MSSVAKEWRNVCGVAGLASPDRRAACDTAFWITVSCKW